MKEDSKTEPVKKLKISLETQALLLKCQAEVSAARCIIERYEDDTKIVSIGEHSNLLELLEDAYLKLEKYNSLFNTIKNIQESKNAVQ